MKKILENFVLDLTTLIRVKRWVTMQKAHFKHILTYIQDYPITKYNLQSKTHTLLHQTHWLEGATSIKHIDLKFPMSNSSIKPWRKMLIFSRGRPLTSQASIPRSSPIGFQYTKKHVRSRRRRETMVKKRDSRPESRSKNSLTLGSSVKPGTLPG